MLSTRELAALALLLGAVVLGIALDAVIARAERELNGGGRA